ncbi:MAG: methylmalonyl Co-A mutase-associated GTPase MeaB [Hydrogenophaga sp.]|nr:methylmalonyl Co-A mutase-associated GTPase MeaB [Hydrogenophaga sp.]
MKPFHVYLLLCRDGTYYAGHTDELEARLLQHQVGDTGYTATRKPVQLVWQGEFESREGALAFEQQIKGWSRAKKEALIAGDWERVQALARSKQAVDGLRQAQPERGGAQTERGGDQPERSGAQPERSGAQVDQEVHRREPTPSVRPEPVEGLTNSIISGAPMAQRRAIAKAITLLESTRADHRAQGDELLTALLPHTGKAFRLGLSGVPGVGKSTFIEALGLYLIDKGHRVAVLTVDPSSTVSGGSILGDKTRMEKLSVHEQAYIRPSPSSGTLGGVAEKTREAMLVCEAAGYDIVIVETVGVGQSETAVSGMTDMFVLMQLPNAGDDLQAIKKGVMELADLVVINKADLDPDAATRARAQITSSLRLLGLQGHPEHAHHNEAMWHPQVIQLSALLGRGVDAFWAEVSRFRMLQIENGQIAARRQQQAKAWMWERIDAGLKQRFRAHPQVRAALDDASQRVLAGTLPASAAARQLLDLFD